MELFAHFNIYGTSVLIASHDLDLIRQMGAPTITLNKGAIERNDLHEPASGERIY